VLAELAYPIFSAAVAPAPAQLLVMTAALCGLLFHLGIPEHSSAALPAVLLGSVLLVHAHKHIV
jgi:hypothetical protein